MRHSYTENKTKVSRKDKLLFLESFYDTLHDHGDTFISCGSYNKDYESIMNILRVQGYFAGVYFRYFFDKDNNFVRAEERKFGS